MQDAYSHVHTHDDFVECGQGHIHWGTYGASGALLRHVDEHGQDRYLLTLRSAAVQQGGVWSIPGGARAAFEEPEAAAIREAEEELGAFPLRTARRIHTNDHGGWQYHSILADVPEMFEPQLDWENDDYGWFTPREVEELPLHPGFRESWNSYAVRETKDKDHTTQSDTELCVMLDIPEAARKQIHGWVQEQDWPKGTELQPPEEYHITLMYTPDGYDEHKGADWIEHLGKVPVEVTAIDVFPEGPDGFPYVLRLDAPEVKRRAVELQDRAEDQGLEITRFPGGYKPHLTVGYGPTGELEAEDIIPLKFQAGPSLVSEPRKDQDPNSKESGSGSERGESSAVGLNLDGHDGDKITDWKLSVKAPSPPNLRPASGKDRCGNCKMFDRAKKVCWGFGNAGADEGVVEHAVCDDYFPAPGYHSSAEEPVSPEESQILDDLSLRSVAHNLHLKFQEGPIDAAGVRDYAERLLKLIGYPPDEMTTMAALQAWQTMYPSDRVLPSGDKHALPPSGDIQAPPTVPTQSWGYGTVSSWPTTFVWTSDRFSAVAAPLYHWTDVSKLHDWMDPSHTGPGATYLTESGDDPSRDWNPDVPYSDQPVRITIDRNRLDPELFDPEYSGWLGNHHYMAPIPRDAIGEVKAFQRPRSWDLGESTEPTEVNNPDDRWPDWGADLGPNKQPHHEIQFGNDVRV